MFGLTAYEVAALAVAVGTAADTAYNSNQAIQKGKTSQNVAMAAAKKNSMLSDEANNAANAKSPDTAAQLQANMAAGKQGAAGTMLTGPGGVDPTTLTLGKSSLLGG